MQVADRYVVAWGGERRASAEPEAHDGRVWNQPLSRCDFPSCRLSVGLLAWHGLGMQAGLGFWRVTSSCAAYALSAKIRPPSALLATVDIHMAWLLDGAYSGAVCSARSPGVLIALRYGVSNGRLRPSVG